MSQPIDLEIELEVRVVAWVLGDVSDFERAELARITAARPEVAQFKARMEAIHGLVEESQSSLGAEHWRLAAARREKLCRELGIEAPAAIPVLEPSAKKVGRTFHWWLLRLGPIAAAIVIMSGLVLLGGSVVLMKSTILPPDFVAEGGVSADLAEMKPGRDKSILNQNLPPSPAEAIPPQNFKGGNGVGGYSDSGTLAGAPKLALPIKALSVDERRRGLDGRSESPADVTAPSLAFAAPPASPSVSTASAFQSATVGRLELQLEGKVKSAKDSVDEEISKAKPMAEREQLARAKEGDLRADSGVAKDRLAMVKQDQAKNEVNLLKSADKKKQADEDRDIPVQAPSNAPAKPAPVEETVVATQPFSTFSLHVSDVSFQLAARALLGEQRRPDPQTVRTEEFINAFHYGDPAPAKDSRVNCVIEQARHPFLPNRNLVRFAIATESSGRSAGQPLRLTVLLDTSGSMEREDRRAALEGAITALTQQLSANDQVTLIGFSRRTRLLADRLSGDQAKTKLLELVRGIMPEGGTNLEEALQTASELARRQFLSGAQNRVVLITDGAANLGNARPEELARVIEGLRVRQIAFDACGVGTDGLNDPMLETLARHGDGRYYLLDDSAESVSSFSRQLAGAFRPAAKNVKVQVRFNPARVSRYRLLGFEHHRLKKEDFRNDQVDAAELAREEAGVALYQIELVPQSGSADGDIGEISVRYEDVASHSMIERSWSLPSGGVVPAFDQAPPSMLLAGTSALLAETLLGSPLGAMTPWNDWNSILTKIRAAYGEDEAVQKLVRMVEAIRAGR